MLFYQKFDSQNINHTISELLYLFANLFQQQGQIDLSQLIASLSDYLNPNFVTNKLLNFENIILSKEISFENTNTKLIADLGSEFKWYINFNQLRSQKLENGAIKI